RVVFRLEHEIRLPELFGQHPSVTFLPLFSRRHIFGIAHRRARINPLDDGRDLFIAQRSIVSEALNANGLVDMPRRHIASDHAFADGFRPRPDFLISHQRHRRGSAFAMALFASLLKDSRDVLGEGWFRWNRAFVRIGRRRNRESDSDDRERRQTSELPKLSHMRLLRFSAHNSTKDMRSLLVFLWLQTSYFLSLHSCKSGASTNIATGLRVGI